MSGPEAKSRLICRTGTLAGHSFELGTETRIGRDPSNHIVLQLPSVSKEHARIRFEDGRYVLEDLGSTHGTRLDGTRIDAPSPLTRLHVIELSDVEFVFTPAKAGRPPASRPGDPSEPEEPEELEEPEASRTDEVDRGGDGGTIVDAAGFGTLPELRGRESGRSGGDRGESGGTIVDSGGFGALPDLGDRKEGGADAPDAEESESGGPAPEIEPAGRAPEKVEDATEEGDGETAEDDPLATQIMTSFPSDAEARYEVTVELPDGGPASFPLTPGDNIVGRGDDCDITIVDPAMWLSRKHAILRVKEDGVELVDLKGVNGTFVDGRKIDTAMLQPGSTFLLGPHLEFELRER